LNRKSEPEIKLSFVNRPIGNCGRCSLMDADVRVKLLAIYQAVNCLVPKGDDKVKSGK